MLPITLGDDVYRDTPDMIYPIIYKLAQLAKESGCAVVLTAYSDGPGGEQGNLWRKEFAEKISSVLCLERQGAESKKIRLHHEKCILAPEGSQEYSSLMSWK